MKRTVIRAEAIISQFSLETLYVSWKLQRLKKEAEKNINIKRVKQRMKERTKTRTKGPEGKEGRKEGRKEGTREGRKEGGKWYPFHSSLVNLFQFKGELNRHIT